MAPGQAHRRKAEAVSTPSLKARRELWWGSRTPPQCPSLALRFTYARAGRLGPEAQAKGRIPQQQPCTSSACPGPTLLLPVPGAGSAQQRREEVGQGEEGAASQLITLGTEPAPPHQ